MAKVTVVGLGPGAWSGLPLGTYRMLEEQQQGGGAIYFRTERHPVVDDLRQQGIVFAVLDHFYEQAENFTDVYQSITEFLLKEALEKEHIIYAVPGHPGVAETTVQNLRRQGKAAGVEIVIGPGHSFLDDLLVAVGVDPADGMLLLDGTSLLPRQLNPSLHTVIMQVYSPDVASDIKLTLMEQYGDEYEVTVVRAIGVPGEERVVTVPLYELDRLDFIDHLTSLFVPKTEEAAIVNRQMWKFVEIIKDLRDPDTGCPWDLKQTHQSLRKYLLEEAYEAADAIDEDDPYALADELGDVLLQIVLHAQIGAEEGTFDIYEVIRSVSDKMIRRHPHVFGGGKEADTAEEVVANWAEIKAQEKEEKGLVPQSLLDDVPRGLPAVTAALNLQKKAAQAGFDWDDIADVYAKVKEEINELQETTDKSDEFGDLLFAMINVARFLDVDPETALAGTNRKFRDRFQYIEARLREQGKTPEQSTLEEMDRLWNEAKRG
ncbi:tetrapyrrole methylase family protein/MazG family protein [Tumebacillus sp. BK434]|uniref:nucleoside triphosphate pyrophosphohydrolase n=1 Tax=Tumebacillus sp. BK434 TaxID=2512169 RepID=UPI0010446AE1|nr:nucleoside triphosphate pyrophosphohydrolase [Tumebacillus sp. BK434]TCP52720.1 tetrapyrrole methylase family protein/MazG family protein [Tumebacillus sp. BK434]